jgi:LPXTG-motif cell wall-anchored protein
MPMRRTIQLLAASCAMVLSCTALVLGSPAGALDNPDYTVPPPATVITTPPPTAPTTPAVQTAVRREAVRTRLAITGSSANFAAALGATLVGLGAAALVLRRRRGAELNA